MGRHARSEDNKKDPLGPPLRSVKARISRWMAPAMIFIVAFVLRLAPLNRYVTPDEPAWVLRSFHFSQALVSGELEAIPATGHPGVTTMWLGSLGLQVHRWLAPEQAADHLDWLDGLAGLSPDSPAAYRHLGFFLSGGRVLIALVTSLGVVGVFVLTSRLWGRTAAALAALFLALDPFFIGHSGLLHLDGMLATFMILSVLSALLAVRPSRLLRAAGPQISVTGLPRSQAGGGTSSLRWVMLSGLLAGLALLTKTPAGFLAPFVVLLLGAAALLLRISRREILIALILWLAAAGLIFLVLYPALWSNPATILRGLLDVAGRHVEGALRPVFFHGQMTYDPSPIFYLVVGLFRISPLVLIGLPLALTLHSSRPSWRRFEIVALIAMALGFGLMVTLVGKKHDRYLLPAFPPLSLVAALGWAEAGSWVRGKLVNRRVFSNPPLPSLPVRRVLVVVLVLVQLLLILPYLTIPLGYFNPLLGGPRTAQNWLTIGWGEGEGAAAHWLARKPDAERLIVATPSIPTFAALFVGQTVSLSDETRHQADYVVHSTLQGADQPPYEQETQRLVYEKTVNGVRYASVTSSSIPAEQATYLQSRARAGDVIILDSGAALVNYYAGDADIVVLDDAPTLARVADQLGALLPGRENVWYVAVPTASPITARHIQQQLVCRGELVFSEAVAGATVSQIVVKNLPTCELTRNTETQASFTFRGARSRDTLALADTFLPSVPIAWPDRLPLIVRWEALTPLSADYRAVLSLKDKAGHVWWEGGGEILDTDYRRPSAWAPGDWSDQTFLLASPPGIPPGQYSIELGVFDPLSGVRLSAWDAAATFVGLSGSLGQITVAPSSRPPTAWDVVIDERLDPPLVAGPLALLGYDPPPARVASGDRVSFDLFWQAIAAPSSDYSLHWGLFSADGNPAYTETVSLSPYATSRWRVQELEQVRYDLPLPPDLAAGEYTLGVSVRDSDGVPVWTESVGLTRIEILARERHFSLPGDLAYPLDFTLGDVVHLRGFDAGDLSAVPGNQIPLTLYWQADGPTERSYTVFVHLVGSDGQLHGQVDRPPAAGAAPTHSWAPGQVIIDEHSLPVLAQAPPGIYHIAVGLYDPQSAVRLPVYDETGTRLANDQILLPVEVSVE